MKPEAQRIAIAEACGWSDIQEPIMFSALMKTPAGIEPGQPDRLFSTIPDYLNSLDAMHEAEKALTATTYKYRFGISTYGSSQVSDYHQLLLGGKQPCFLEDGCGKRDDMPQAPPSLPHLAGGFSATAAQRAEAFLRTIGKWEDES